ncbi:MAG: PDZ domain-containing protein [Gemmataceae bacterium]|nr:PDZ domain-containing protein [Gemmataceae bacterium]
MRGNLCWFAAAAVGIGLLTADAHGQSVVGVRFEDSGFGAKVESVVAGSPAAKVGVKPGDTINAINGREISGPNGVRAVLGQSKPGDQITLTVDRDGKSFQFTLTTVSAQQLAAGAALVDPRQEAVAELRAVYADLIDPRRINRVAEFISKDRKRVEPATMAGEIRGIVVDADRITDKTFQFMAACPNLELIVVRDRIRDPQKFTGSGLAALQGHKNLKSLWFDAVNVGEEHVRQAGRLTQLTSLALDGAPLQLDWMEHLKSLDKLESLWLRKSSIGDEHLDVLANHPRLKKLDLNYTGIRGPGLAAVGKLKHLEYLDLEGTGIGDDGLKHLEACGELLILDVSRTRFTAAGLSAVNKLTKLRELALDYCADEIGGTGGIAAVPLQAAAAANGIDLTKRKARFTAAQLVDQLSGLTQLTELSLRGIKYSPDEVRALSRKWPTATIRLANNETVRPAQ